MWKDVTEMDREEAGAGGAAEARGSTRAWMCGSHQTSRSFERVAVSPEDVRVSLAF